VEFALVALVLYVLLAATIEFGRALHGSQTIQQAADLMARELARTPLAVSYTSLNGTGMTGPADTTAALNDPTVRQRIFDERLLVIDLAQKNSGDLDQLFASFPVVNQQLRTVMIFDQELGRPLLRYPGALVTPGNEANLPALPAGFTDSGLRIAVPLVVTRTDPGVTAIQWLPVVEEVTPTAFSLSSGLPQSGTVGVRINYPFQAATLSEFRQSPNGPFEPNGTLPSLASDSGITETNSLPPGQSTVVPADPPARTDGGLQPYGGKYGLGYQLALGQRLRPFRKLLSAQAVYRREVFGN
jgi:hypothetical protein